MSKQSDAKAAKGYEQKPVPKTCANCKNFVSEKALPAWMAIENKVPASYHTKTIFTAEEHGIEKNMRCAINGFPVKKMATCRLFDPKTKGESNDTK